jgi:hypothetical protein
MPVTGSLHEKLTVTSGEKVDVNILTIRHQDSTETPTGIPSCRVGQGVRTDEHHG